jgi:hypothetical protein
VQFSILINELLSGFFSNLRRLRQGDPLCPLLFVVIIEAFSMMMSATMYSGLLSVFLVGLRNHEQMLVSHLLFANDMLIIFEPSGEQLRNLRCLLLSFEVVLGLKINLSKSEIISLGYMGDVEGLASILGVEWLCC